MAYWWFKKLFKVSALSFQAGITGDRFLGPRLLTQHLTGAVYDNFLWNILSELLLDATLQSRIGLWFMHDGAPPHFLLALQEFLNSMFLEQWVGWGGPTAWHTRFPDLNPWIFISGTCKVYCLCCRSQWLPWLVTKKKLSGFLMTYTMPGILQLVDHCSDVWQTSCVDTLNIAFNLQEVVTWKLCSRTPVFVVVFVLWCRLTFCGFCSAFFVYCSCYLYYYSRVNMQRGVFPPFFVLIAGLLIVAAQWPVMLPTLQCSVWCLFLSTIVLLFSASTHSALNGCQAVKLYSVCRSWLHHDSSHGFVPCRPETVWQTQTQTDWPADQPHRAES
jgi:hypothetical protein